MGPLLIALLVLLGGLLLVGLWLMGLYNGLVRLRQAVKNAFANIDVQLAHKDFRVLEKASDRIRASLREYQGVSDIEDTYARGKQEIKLKLKPAARTLGVAERS